MIFLGVTILQGVEFPIFLLIFAWDYRNMALRNIPKLHKLKYDVISAQTQY